MDTSRVEHNLIQLHQSSCSPSLITIFYTLTKKRTEDRFEGWKAEEANKRGITGEKMQARSFQ